MNSPITPLPEGNKPKFSLISLIIGIICGILLITVTFLIVKFYFKDNKDDSVTESSVTVSTMSPSTNGAQLLGGINANGELIKGTEPDDKSVKITSDLQYDLNIFLSNFSESDLPNFRMGERLSNDELIYFAELYNIYNRHELFENVEYREEEADLYRGNIRIKKEYIYETIKKYFDITMDEDVLGDYLYTEFTGGHMSEGVSIVNKAENLGDNLYRISFEVYATGGMDSDYYSFSPQEAKKYYLEAHNGSQTALENVRTGTAIIYAKDINDRSTYILKEYQHNNR